MEYETNIFDFEINNNDNDNKTVDKSIIINEMIINRYNKYLTKSIRDFKEISNIELKENEQIRIITNKSINAITLIDLYSKIYKFTEMFIAIYRMNLFTVNWIVNYVNLNKDVIVNIIISDFFRENKKYEHWAEYIYNCSFKYNNLNVKFVNNHSKIFLGHTKCNRHIVFEGSGNLSDNARIEQYLLEDNKIIYDFHKSWMLEMLCKTI